MHFVGNFSSWDKLIQSAAWLLKIKWTLRNLGLQKKANQTIKCPVKTDVTGQLFVEDLAKAEESLVSYNQ